MAWQPTFYSVLGLLAAVLSVAVSALAWRHRDQRGARALAALMLALAGWSLVYGVQLGYRTLAGQFPWQLLALWVSATIPPLWLVFTVRYAGEDHWLSRPVYAILVLEPLAFGLLVMTNASHRLVWEGTRMMSTGSDPVIALAFGPAYYTHIAYSYLLVAAGIAVLLGVAQRASAVYRRQTGILVGGALPPFAASVAFTLRMPWGPMPGLDLTPFAFAFTGGLFGLALFRFDLLERTPIAREQALDALGEGLLVLDGTGRVVDTNAIARAAFGPTPKPGDPVETILDDDSPAEATLSSLDGQTVRATVDGRERTYDVDTSPLADHRDRTVGHVLALRDVTDREVYEQRLEVAQRVLRHNLRNEMNVIRGQAASLDDPRAEAIVDRADELLDITEKTKAMADLAPTTAGATERVDVHAEVERLASNLRESVPEATIEVDVPAELHLSVPAVGYVTIPIENLLENAVEHNDRSEPWVEVGARVTDGETTITVADDGPTIPEMERQVLEAGREDPLNHGSGLGLWLSHWSLQAVGGVVEFQSRQARGNRVTLRYPMR